MGGLVSLSYLKPSTKRRSYVDQLRDIENETSKLAESRSGLERNYIKFRRKFVSYSLLCYSALLAFTWVVVCLLSPSDWVVRRRGFLFTLCFGFVPFALIICWKLMRYTFERQITHTDACIEQLQQRKNRLIEEIKSNESYRAAKELLDRFSENYSGDESTDGLRRRKSLINRSAARPEEISGAAEALDDDATFSNAPGDKVSSPVSRPRTIYANKHGDRRDPVLTVRLPRTLISPNRGFFIRLLEWILDDGPNRRYALICKQCQSHNGMAFKEEFPSLSYKCAFCGYFNQAKKLQILEHMDVEDHEDHQSWNDTF